MDDELTKTAVLPHLSTGWLGQNYHFYNTITSTNDILKEWVNQGAADQPPAGTVLAADYQSAGRGRMSRRWEAEPGTSLMFSLLLRPNWPAQQLTWLTMIASLAVVEAAEHLVSVPLGVKWPNDVMLSLDGGWRKWGGLLLEGGVGEDGRLQTAILGIGLNVNMTAVQLPEGLTPVSSLSLAAGHRLSRRRLLVDILASLERHYEAAAAGDSPQTRWRERLITLGQAVTVHQAGQAALQGQAVDVDAWGQLLVQTRDGRMHTIAAGDVSLRG